MKLVKVVNCTFCIVNMLVVVVYCTVRTVTEIFAVAMETVKYVAVLVCVLVTVLNACEETGWIATLRIASNEPKTNTYAPIREERIPTRAGVKSISNSRRLA